MGRLMADLERKLVSAMTDLKVIADVDRSGLTVDVFEVPIIGQIFTWIIDYWSTNKKAVAPTAEALNYEFPGVGFEERVEESVDWLIDSLKRRLLVNKAHALMRSAIGDLSGAPEETVRQLHQGFSELVTQSATGQGCGAPRLWSAADLTPAAQPRWLAKNRLPRAAVSLLVGDEGIGKSLFWVYLAAAITTGKPLVGFGVPARNPAHVFVVVTEDDWSTTVRPRLEVAGADLDMLRVICAEADGSGAPEFPRDLSLIADADPAPALVVVDAWLDTVSARLSVKDPQHARQALHPWKDVATTTDAAVLLLTHTNRVASAKARDKYGATGELRKKARMALFALRDDDGNLVIGPDKANAAASVTASRFTVRGVPHFAATEDHDGTMPLLVYVGDTDQTAQQLVADDYTAGRGSVADDHPIIGWLASYLAGGPRWARDGFAAAEAEGFSADQVKRAKKRLHVESQKPGASGWFWRLPGHEGEPADDQEVAGASV